MVIVIAHIEPGDNESVGQVDRASEPCVTELPDSGQNVRLTALTVEHVSNPCGVCIG